MFSSDDSSDSSDSSGDSSGDCCDVISCKKIIIGYAGYGKSTKIINDYDPKEYLLMAFTGIAASEINGSTINSTFKLGLNADIPAMSAYLKIGKKNEIASRIHKRYSY